jgi:hypothetical protein
MTGDVAEAVRGPSEPESASLAAADAVSVRLHEILPETPEAAEPTPAAAESEAAPAYVAEAGPQAAHTAAPALLDELSASAEPAPIAPPLAEAAAEPSWLFKLAPALSPPPPAEADPMRLDTPEHEPADLSRRVVWREAPVETDASRLLGNGFKGLSLLWLAVLFLVGVAVFAGGIMWGWSTKGSGLVSWLLGLIGIVCVAGSVYVYLERLGEREE